MTPLPVDDSQIISNKGTKPKAIKVKKGPGKKARALKTKVVYNNDTTTNGGLNLGDGITPG